MGAEQVLMIVALVFGFYMAWSIGANDVANAMGTSVGSGALTIKKALIVAGVLEFAGALLVGSHVSETIRSGIISPDLPVFQENPMILVYGMTASLLSAAIWLQIASYLGWPVSTTHSIVGAVLGFGLVVGGMEAANWSEVSSIVSSWIISPVLSGSVAFVLFSILRRIIYDTDDAVAAAKKVTPYLVFTVFWVLTLTTVFKGLKNLNLNLGFLEASILGSAIGLLAALISFFLVRRIKSEPIEERVWVRQPLVVEKSLSKVLNQLSKAANAASGEVKERLDGMINELEATHKEVARGMEVERGSGEYKTVQRIFVYLQIMSAALVAFAHGANDVANAIGPLAAVITILQSGQMVLKTAVPVWLLGVGGAGIVLGLATWGWRVMLTIGKKITELTPTRGFTAEFSAALTILFASKLGLPISTTHTLVGAVLGVGLARGIGALNLRVVLDIVISWVITVPVGAIGAIIFFYILRAVFGG